MRVLMLVAAGVAEGCFALRQAESLARRGDEVHVVGTRTPVGLRPPAGISVWPAPEALLPARRGSDPLAPAPRPGPAARVGAGLRYGFRPRRERHATAAWVRRAYPAATAREADVVHAIGLDALALGHRVAAERDVPLIYHADAGPSDRAGRGVRAERRLGADARVVVAAAPVNLYETRTRGV